MPRLRSREPGGAALLRPVRGPDRVAPARAAAPRTNRTTASAARAAARCVADAGEPPPPADPARGLRAAAGLGAVRRPGRLHDAVRAPRSRGGPRAASASYFDRCRTLIERYGGTVEKFIGDAVMAVWGTPVAREDDAERAVRAALALTQAVDGARRGGRDAGAAGPRGRADRQRRGRGRRRGRGDGAGRHRQHRLAAAVDRRAGRRCWSTTSPGGPREAAIAYEDAGTHQVKGREQPVHAWTALRVVAGAGGARAQRRARGAVRRAATRELRPIIDAGEASAQRAARAAGHGDRRGRDAASRGCCGSSSSTSTGIEDVVAAGTRAAACPTARGSPTGRWPRWSARGPGSSRRRTPDGRAGEAARRGRASTCADERERRLVEPRLAHLLGLEERTAPDRADLFSGWRLFFERMADAAPGGAGLRGPAVGRLAACSTSSTTCSSGRPTSRSSSSPSAARSSATARPDWAPRSPSSRSPRDAMRELLGGPRARAARTSSSAGSSSAPRACRCTRSRRCGCCSDRGLLAQEGARYVVTGESTTSTSRRPCTRWSPRGSTASTPAERALLQDAVGARAVVHGRRRWPRSASARSTRSSGCSTRLVAKQVARLQRRPRSRPSEGSTGSFRRCCGRSRYGTLSRRDRKARHLAAARHLQQAWGSEAGEIAEVLATHYLDAAARRAGCDRRADDPRVGARDARRGGPAGRIARARSGGSAKLRPGDRAGRRRCDPCQPPGAVGEGGVACR